MSDANYRIRYKKGDFEVEVQGDKVWVEEKFEELNENMPTKVAPPSSSGCQKTASAVVNTSLPASLAEFLKAKGSPKLHRDRLLLFAYWLLKKEKMQSYNISDMENCYDQVRIPKPKNITDSMNKIQPHAYLMAVKEEKDGKKAWVITPTGEKYVEQMKV